MTRADELTVGRVREVLHYNRHNGKFKWLVSLSKRIKVGEQAGSVKPNGYRQIQIDGNLYQAHNLAWFICKGKWPYYGLDHINRDKDFNSIYNIVKIPALKSLYNIFLTPMYFAHGKKK